MSAGEIAAGLSGKQAAAVRDLHRAMIAAHEGN
jgi:hypothetical protein